MIGINPKIQNFTRWEFFSISFLVILVIFLFAPQVHAGECFEHPAVMLDGSATVKSGVFVRTVACMDGSEIITTLAAGEVVATMKYDDGWYEIKRADGTTGWVWGDFLDVSAEPIAFEGDESDAKLETSEESVELPDPDELLLEARTYYDQTQAILNSSSLLERVKGRILLQVEQHGEAWYVHPDEGVRYYMKDGPTAYEMMRAFGVGISDDDLNKIAMVSSVESFSSIANACTDDISVRMRGRILLQVEQHGEAWYVHPENCFRIYMKDGDAAYSIMRELSLGISDADLSTIASKIFESLPYTEEETLNTSTVAFTQSANFQDIQTSISQAGIIPTGIDTVALNAFWLDRINDLRQEAGLRELVLDQRLVDTASMYAGIMQENQFYAHEREDGSSMHQWIDQQGLDFTDRYAIPDGWRSNYFTENITWGYSDGTTSGVEQILQDAMDMYLAERSYNGAHYRTIYHEDWNSVGLGFYFEDIGNGMYKVYVAMHYGSLELE